MTLPQIHRHSSFEHDGITVKIKQRRIASHGSVYTDYGYDAGMGVAAFGQSTPEEAEHKARQVLDSMRKSI